MYGIFLLTRKDMRGLVGCEKCNIDLVALYNLNIVLQGYGNCSTGKVIINVIFCNKVLLNKNESNSGGRSKVIYFRISLQMKEKTFVNNMS